MRVDRGHYIRRHAGGILTLHCSEEIVQPAEVVPPAEKSSTRRALYDFSPEIGVVCRFWPTPVAFERENNQLL